ncbi:MAG: dTDP-4-dehydrorhamnose 3,5-epimerase [Desulfobacterales bacterium]|nr:dTDP-4-dehydrorhamnose 3,5-epimerase [Desulfobacterales bacterium]
MKIITNKLSGVAEIILEPRVDQRGFFMRTFDEKQFRDMGLNLHWSQENHSRSDVENTVRGLHFYLPPHGEAKMLRVIRGRIFDVVVDLRKNSPTFGHWESFDLHDEDFKWLYISAGFAHGFCTLEQRSEILYKQEKYFSPEIDSGIFWNDQDLKISWPVQDPIISAKDKGLMSMRRFIELYGGI